MKVLAYLRCSTNSQEIESQKRQIDAWATANDHQVTYFKDDATSGKTTARLGLDTLLVGARTGCFPLLVVTELSRLGRSISHVHQVVEQLTAAGVKIAIASTGAIIDYATLEGRALIGALALASDLEWHIQALRSARGRATIRAKGIKVGRKPKPISDTVLRALRAQGLSVRQIARELGEAPSTVGRRLQALAADAA